VDEFEGFEGGKIVYEPAPDVPPLPFDRERMRRVLVNLVTNAVQAVTAKSDYAKSKGLVYRPHVSIGTRRKENQVVILVEDNGIGMDQQTLAHAFEALYTTRAKGTGLGLAIVKKIVDEHGGTVSLESNPEKGTQARIVLQISDG
jgi:signal transduction histidine kinase